MRDLINTPEVLTEARPGPANKFFRELEDSHVEEKPKCTYQKEFVHDFFSKLENNIYNVSEKNESSYSNNSDILNTSDETSEKDVSNKKGGSYGEVFKDGEGDKYEVHHIPADTVSPLERKDGPAIKMEKNDHRQTASCGSSREAREYREAQKELIDKGKFREAMQMDIDDIHDKFGDKYDDAIAEMNEYADKLEMEGKIDG